MTRVSDSFPKLSYLPIIPTLHDSETSLDIDFNASFTSQDFDENVLFVDPKFFKMTERHNENTHPNIEPVVKISPPTPLKKISKNDTVTIAKDAEEQHIIVKNKRTIKKVDSCKGSEINVPSKNFIMPYDGSRDGKVYSKKTCPIHKHESAIKIFDDDIEKYLRDDPRAISSNQKLIKLPSLQNASNKYDKIENKITSAKNKKIKEITPLQKKLEDNTIELTANKITKIDFKDDTILNKQCNLTSDFLTSNYKFPLSKISKKEEKTTKNMKITFPKSFQSQSKIETSSDKLTKCPKLQKYVNNPKTREKPIDESK